MAPLIALAAVLAGAPNLLPGDTGFDCGPGPFQILAPPTGPAPTLREGVLRLPAGAELLVPLSPPLEAKDLYTLAWSGRGDGGPALLEAEARDRFGRGETARFRLDQAWRPSGLTFQAEPPPRDPEQARAMKVDFDRRGESEPPEWVDLPTVSLRIRVLEGVAALDDVRLVPGPEPVDAEPVTPAVDVVWGDGTAGPFRHGQDSELIVRALGPPAGVTGVCRVLRHDGRVWRELRLEPRADNAWQIAAGDLRPGCYIVELSVVVDERRAARLRPLFVLEDRRTVASPFSFESAAVARAAEAAALGYGQVRLVATWAELAEADGAPRWSAIDALLGPALAAGVRVTFALRLTPADALPAKVRTPRRMDSHGYATGTTLPDVGRWREFVTAVAWRYRGVGLTYELDDQAFRYWHGNDYTEYLRRFREWVRAADPSARVAGIGHVLESTGDSVKLTAFEGEVAGRGGLAMVESLTGWLPGRLGDSPEEWLGIGAAVACGAWTSLPSGPDLQLVSSGTAPVGPLWRDEPRWTSVGGLAAEVSPWQLSARWLRAWLLSLRARPAVFPSGWQGGCGPREIAAQVWLERYLGSRYVADVDLGAGLGAVVFERPLGTGLAAVWNWTDRRWSVRDVPTEPLPILTLDADRTLFRVRDLYGAPVWERGGGEPPTLALGFEPLYIEGSSPGDLLRLLRSARVDGAEMVRAAATLEMGPDGPALAVELANDGSGIACGEVAWRPSPGLELAGAWQGYELLPGERQRLRAPITRWSGGLVPRVRVLAETGTSLYDGRRALVRLPWPERGPFIRIDGDESDWPAAAATFRLDSGDRLIGPDSEWQGPDDLSATVRLAYGDGTIWLLCDVTDERLSLSSSRPLEDADAVAVYLDLDLAGDALDPRMNSDDVLVVLAPTYDGVVQSRHRVVRAAGAGPVLLDADRIRCRVLQRAGGYRCEVALPLTADGRAAVEGQGGFGFELVLHDDDTGAGRRSGLVLFGDPPTFDRPDGWALVWLDRDGRTAWEAEAPAPPAAKAPGVGFETLDEPYRLVAQPPDGATVSVRANADFVRGERILRIRLPSDGQAVRVAELTAPPGRQTTTIWARARVDDRQCPPRLGVEGTRGVEWREPAADWHRYGIAVEGGAMVLVAAGRGEIEVAEIRWTPASPGVR